MADRSLIRLSATLVVIGEVLFALEDGVQDLAWAMYLWTPSSWLLWSREVRLEISPFCI